MPEHDYGYDEIEEQKRKLYQKQERKRNIELGFIELDRDLSEILNVKWIHKNALKKLKILLDSVKEG